MTSEQVMLTLTTLCLAFCLAFVGCQSSPDDRVLLSGMYPRRQVWAVVPLRNESGSLHADGAIVADHLVSQLENVPGIDVLPVNRVLAAMQSLKMPAVESPAQAMTLVHTLEVDGLVVGTITAYEPYDPPKLGMAVELYVDTRLSWFGNTLDVKRLSQAATEQQVMGRQPAWSSGSAGGAGQPISAVSGFYDAADPVTRLALQRYAAKRGGDARNKNAWRLYRINMNLYTEFVTHAVCLRLMQAEAARLAALEHIVKPAS